MASNESTILYCRERQENQTRSANSNTQFICFPTENEFFDEIEKYSNGFVILGICAKKGIEVNKTNILEVGRSLENDYKAELMERGAEFTLIEDFIKSLPFNQCLNETTEGNYEHTDSDTFSSNESNEEVNFDDYLGEIENRNHGEDPFTNISHWKYSWERLENEDFSKPFNWLLLPFYGFYMERIDILQLAETKSFSLQYFKHNGGTLLHYAMNKFVNKTLLNYIIRKIPAFEFDHKYHSPLTACLSSDLKPEEKLGNITTYLECAFTLQMLPDKCYLLKNYSQIHPIIDTYLSSLAFCMTISDLAFWHEILSILLEFGAEINAINSNGDFALITAVRNVPPLGYEEDIQAEEGLHVRKIKLNIIKFLLNHGADPNTQDLSKMSAVNVAVFNHNPDVLNLILENGGKANIKDDLQMTPLFQLSILNEWTEPGEIDTIFTDLAKILISFGCDINEKAVDKSTCVFVPLISSTKYFIQKLIQLGANLNCTDYLSRSPLHMAVRNEDSDVFNLLIQNQAKVDILDIHQNTVLHYACLFSKVDIIKYLIKNGMNINAKADRLITPIHLAAENGDGTVLQILLDAGADINVKDVDGATPLHYAASDGNLDATIFLCKIQAECNVKDLGGMTPFLYAIQNGYLKVAEILQNNSCPLRFGSLPSGWFPNRPLVDFCCVDDYFLRLKHDLQAEFSGPHKFVNSILTSRGLGVLDFSCGEEKIILEGVIRFVELVVKRIEELNPLFKCKLIQAGSVLEKTKVGKPDEFDFLCVLENFSDNIKFIEGNSTDVFDKIILKDQVPHSLQRYCIKTSTFVLNSTYLLSEFFRLCTVAIFDVHSSFNGSFYTGMANLVDFHGIFTNKTIPLSNLHGFNMSWRGLKYKILDISIDLNPVLFYEKWPKTAAKSIYSLPNVCDNGIFLIPKRSRQITFPPRPTTPLSSEFWRFSTHHLEFKMLKGAPENYIHCYSFCKILRLEPLVCGIKVNDKENEDEYTAEKLIPSYYIKCVLLTKLELDKEHSEINTFSVIELAHFVYAHLLQAFLNQKKIESPFFPGVDIGKKPDEGEINTVKNNFKISFCKNILGVLDVFMSKQDTS